MSKVNRDILSVVRAMRGDQQRYKREQSRAVKAIVSEVYSPPRVTAAIKLFPERRLIPGFALDLTTADVDGALWDFDSKVMRERAMQKVKDERPQLLTWLSHVHRVFHLATHQQSHRMPGDGCGQEEARS